MCHHYRTREARKLGLKPEWDNEFSLRANLYQLTLPLDGFYPLAQVPVVRLNDAGQRELVPIEWGFLPAWWKPSDKTPKRAAFQRKCINARSEDVDAKPTYRDSFRRRRCLMPADEFFERDISYGPCMERLQQRVAGLRVRRLQEGAVLSFGSEHAGELVDIPVCDEFSGNPRRLYVGLG